MLIRKEEKKIPKVTDLLKEYEHVYVVISRRKEGRMFMKEMIEEGFSFPNGKKMRKSDWGHFMGFSKNEKTVGYVSTMVLAFVTSKQPKNHVCISYSKYLAGDEDYIYTNNQSNHVIDENATYELI